MFITDKRLLKWALYSNTIYVLLLFLIRPQGINIKKVAITSLLLFSVLAIILLTIKNINRLKEISKLGRILFFLIIFTGCIVIIRGFSFSIQDWVTNFGNVYMGLAWLVPCVLILGLKIENWKVVFMTIKFMFQLMLFLFFITLFFVDDYVKWAWLLRPVNFVLLIGLYKYIGKIKTALIIIIYILIAIWVKQRMDLLFLTMTFGLLLLNKLLSIKVKKRFLKYILASFIIVFTLIFTIGYEDVSLFIARFIEFQDSRTFVYNEIFYELSATKDQYFGRGSLGTYFSEFMEGTRKHWNRVGRVGWQGDVPIRITVEVGYLQMLLKGGLVLLILNVSMSVYAIYLAIFKSKNKFIKQLGYYILIISALSLVSFRPAFTPTFIIFWMAIGTVLSKKNRNMGDGELNELLKMKNGKKPFN